MESESRKVPVVMISYNRPDLVRLTMENVALADSAVERDIIMFIDGPRNDADIKKQDEIFRIVSAYQARLPRLEIVRRERNYGCRGNIVDAISSVVNRMGRVIVIEDDILVSRTFLRYMDEALEYYERDERIWGVNAYQNPYFKVPKKYPYDLYLNPVNMCWGWGTWKDRWDEVDFDLKDWPKDRKDMDLVDRLNKAGRYIIPLLEAQYAGLLKTWDVQCTYHIVKHGLRCVEPIHQLSKNIGFGTDGEHCLGNMPLFTRQKYFNFMPKMLKDIAETDEIQRQWEWLSVSKNFLDRIQRRLKREAARFRKVYRDPLDIE